MPEEGGRLGEFQSDLRFLPVIPPDEVHRACHLFPCNGINEGNLLSPFKPCGEFKQTTVGVHAKRFRRFFKRQASIFRSNDHGYREVNARGAPPRCLGTFSNLTLRLRVPH